MSGTPGSGTVEGSEWDEPLVDAEREAEERAREECERRAIMRRRAVRSIAGPGPELDAALRDDDPGVRRAALSSPYCTLADRLHTIQYDPDPSTVARAVSLLTSWQDMPCADVAALPWQARIELLRLPDCPIEVRLAMVLDDRVSTVRDAADRQASDPRPDEVWRILRGGPSHWAEYTAKRWDCFTSASTSDFTAIQYPGARRILAVRAGALGREDLLAAFGLQDPDPDVRRTAVAEAAFPPARLPDAVRDPTQAVRAAVLTHPEVPPAVVAQLAADHHRAVRVAALGHRACPAPVLAAAWERESVEERLAALGNPACPADVVERALVGGDATTRLVALRASADRVSLTIVFECLQEAVRRIPAIRSDSERRTVEEVRDLAADSLAVAAIRRWPEVAGLPLDQLPSSLLAPIVLGDLSAAARDGRPKLRSAVAGQDGVARSELSRLASDSVDAVRVAVAGRCGLPVEIQRLLIVGMPPRVGEILAAHVDLAPEVAAHLALHGDRRVKLTLVDRSDATVELLRGLLGDDDEAVRAAVSRRLMDLFGG